MSKFKQIAQLKKDYEAAVRTVGKDAFTELLAPLFVQFPNVQAVRWNQYTPYFNDGDPCTFRCHASDCDIDFGDPDGTNEDDDSGFTSYSDDPDREAALRAFGEALCEPPDDVFESVFGDGYQITANRDGSFDVNEYSHD